MRKIKEILRLHFEHQQGRRAIARACQISPTTVSDYIAKAQQAGLDAQGIGALSDEALHRLFFPETPTPSPKKAALDFPAMQKELQKKSGDPATALGGVPGCPPRGLRPKSVFSELP